MFRHFRLPLEQKKDMKIQSTIRRGICLLAALASFACVELESPQNPSRPSRDPSDDEDVKEDIQTREVLSYCGVKYPSGYDWRSDPQYGNVKCKLFLNVDGEDIMEMNTGYEYGISPDPDSHHIVNECLYTDFSNETETVLRRNGKEIFRYAGREMIVGLAVREEVVYTLGQSRSGLGFSFRANGKVLLASSTGRLFTILLENGDELYFGYEEDAEYFIWRNGGSSRLDSMGYRLSDMRIAGDNIVLLAGGNGSPATILKSGLAEDLDMMGALGCYDCKFLQDGKDLIVTGYLELRDEKGKILKHATKWPLPNTDAYLLTSEWEALSYFLKDGKFCYIAGRWYRFPYMMVCWESHSFVSKDMYIYPNRGCGIIHNGELYAGISRKDTGEACILTESGIRGLGFNGCITQFALSRRVINTSGR